MDYKLQILGFAGQADEVAAAILAKHGANFDAERGDFTVGTEEAGGRVVIYAKEVGRGDMKMLAEDLHQEVDPFTLNSEITIIASEQIDGHWFNVDLDGEDD